MLFGVILAAGSGKRMKMKEKKQFIKINDKPIFEYSVDKFLSIKRIDRIIIVINKEDKNNIAIKNTIVKYKKYIDKFKINIIIGGEERYNSVYNTLKFIDNYYGILKDDKIIIHDAARPNVDIKDVKKLIDLLDKYKSITLATTLNDTIKQVKNSHGEIKSVIKTINRDEYRLIKTPQGFDLNLLYDCYDKFINSKIKTNLTDDLQIIENYSKTKSFILDSNPLNLKITTKDELEIMKNLL